MNWKTIGISLAVAGCVVGAGLAIHRNQTRPAHTVHLRIKVSPPEQSAFVVERAKSAQFKYLIGKYAGLKPGLAQKLAANAVPNSAEVEVEVGLDNPEEGRRYVEGFVETLQTLCGQQVHLALANQTIK